VLDRRAWRQTKDVPSLLDYQQTAEQYFSRGIIQQSLKKCDNGPILSFATQPIPGRQDGHLIQE